MNDAPRAPQATKRVVLAPGTGVSMCGACGLVFRAVSGFARHRRDDACLTEAQLRALGFTTNPLGQWVMPAGARTRRF